MAVGGGEGLSIMQTPSWLLALVFLCFTITTLAIEKVGKGQAGRLPACVYGWAHSG